MNDIDFQKLDNERWNYLKGLFPKTFEQIKEWNFNIDDDDNPYECWLDDQSMYKFFDNKGIYVCPQINEQNEFYVDVCMSRGLKNSKYQFKNRTEAEYHGFLIAFFLNEKQHE